MEQISINFEQPRKENEMTTKEAFPTSLLPLDCRSDRWATNPSMGGMYVNGRVLGALSVGEDYWFEKAFRILVTINQGLPVWSPIRSLFVPMMEQLTCGTASEKELSDALADVLSRIQYLAAEEDTVRTQARLRQFGDGWPLAGFQHIGSGRRVRESVGLFCAEMQATSVLEGALMFTPVQRWEFDHERSQ